MPGSAKFRARKCWARLHRVLRAETADPRTCATFYRATVQAVLLFGSETWSITPSDRKLLEGFHTRCAWRMAQTNRPRRGPDGSWSYPLTEDVLKEVHLRTVDEYILERRQTIASYIASRPIFEECRGRERKRGTVTHQWWWEQPMGLDGG